MHLGDGAVAGEQCGDEAGRAPDAAYRLQIEAEQRQLARVESFIADCAGRLGIIERALYDMTVATVEIVTNCMVHGYAGGPGRIDIALWLVGTDLFVRICDEAPAFDPTTVPAPDTSLPPHERPPGGMGLHLTRRFVDEMSYRARPRGGNEVTLMRRNAINQGEP